MSLFKKEKKEVPAISTASLPDIVFILLFFFMVVTKMREISPKVQVKLPAATELTKMEPKQLLLSTEIQINNRIINRTLIIAIINLNFSPFNNKSVQGRIKFNQCNLIKFKIPHFLTSKLLECVTLVIIFQINNQDIPILHYQTLDYKIIKTSN